MKVFFILMLLMPALYAASTNTIIERDFEIVIRDGEILKTTESDARFIVPDEFMNDPAKHVREVQEVVAQKRKEHASMIVGVDDAVVAGTAYTIYDGVQAVHGVYTAAGHAVRSVASAGKEVMRACTPLFKP